MLHRKNNMSWIPLFLFRSLGCNVCHPSQKDWISIRRKIAYFSCFHLKNLCVLWETLISSKVFFFSYEIFLSPIFPWYSTSFKHLDTVDRLNSVIFSIRKVYISIYCSGIFLCLPSTASVHSNSRLPGSYRPYHLLKAMKIVIYLF